MILNVVDPATEQVVGVAPTATFSEFDATVSVAERAFPAWRCVPRTERSMLLLRLAVVLEPHCDDLATILTFEQGRPLSQARMKVMMAATFVRTVAALQLKTTVLATEPSRLVTMHHDAIGR